MHPPSGAPSAKRAKLNASTASASTQQGITPTPAHHSRQRQRGTTPSTGLRSRLPQPHTASTRSRAPLMNSSLDNHHGSPPVPSIPSKFTMVVPPPSSDPLNTLTEPQGPGSLKKHGFGIGLGPPPPSSSRQVSAPSTSPSSSSSTSTIRLVSGSSSGTTARSFSEASYPFRTSNGALSDMAALVMAKGRRASFRPRPSLNDMPPLPLPLQEMMESSRSWALVKEESDEEVEL
jgi:hypothetical protein